MHVCDPPLLTRFEAARIIGLRSLQLSEGDPPKVAVSDATLRHDYMYVAALELLEQRLDVIVQRGAHVCFHLRDAVVSADVTTLLNTRDGQERKSAYQTTRR